MKLVVAVALAMAVPGLCIAGSGSSQMNGTLVLTATRCKRITGHARGLVQLSDSGSWSVGVQTVTLGGTWTAADASGRKLALAFDEASLGSLSGLVASDATDACHATVQLSGATPDVFTLTFNRKHTRATLVVKFHFTGTPGSKGETVKEKVVMHGRWRAA